MRLLACLTFALSLSAQTYPSPGPSNAPHSSSTISRVGAPATGANSGGTSSSLNTSTASISLTAGNAIVVCATAATSGITFTFSDSLGDSYVALTPVLGSGYGLSAGCGYALNVTAGTNVVFTVGFSSPVNYTGLVAQQYTNVLTAGALDIQATSYGPSATAPQTHTISGLSTVQANEVVVAFSTITGVGSNTYTAGTLNGVAMTLGGNSTSNVYFAAEDLVVSTLLSSVSATIVASASANWEMAAVSLK